MARELESWQARVRTGVVEYSSVRVPLVEQTRARLSGLDGGDLLLPLAQGHGPVAVDGGDLADPQWQWQGSPLRADGGVFS